MKKYEIPFFPVPTSTPPGIFGLSDRLQLGISITILFMWGRVRWKDDC